MKEFISFLVKLWQASHEYYLESLKPEPPTKFQFEIRSIENGKGN